MRKRTAMMLLMAFGAGAPAAAANETPPDLETVLVQSDSLDGIWKISFPVYSGGLSLWHGFQGPLKRMQTGLCRINDRTVRCIGGGLMMEATVSLKGTRAHFAWGSTMVRPVIDATFESATQFTGVYTFKLSGIEYTAPDPANGTKLILSATPPSDDKDGLLLARLLGEMNSGAPSESLDAQAKDVQIPPQDELRSLGAVQSVLYLGESGEFVRPKMPAKHKIPTDLKVYDVEFANGERLCGLRHGANGKVDGFKCV